MVSVSLCVACIDLCEATAAYKKQSLELHPDKQRMKSEAERAKAKELFLKMTAAHNILSDLATRRAYDHARDTLDARNDAGLIDAGKCEKPAPTCVEDNDGVVGHVVVVQHSQQRADVLVDVAHLTQHAVYTALRLLERIPTHNYTLNPTTALHDTMCSAHSAQLTAL